MAIDTLAKRASVASLGLAFLGPSIIPSGTIGAAERQVSAHSYYGILAGAGETTLGGTSQLENYASSGGITLERVVGATSQIEAYTSSGGITLERVLGGTSQLQAFTSSAVITVGDGVTTAKGGYVPAKRVKTKLKKRDEEILDQVNELVAKLEEVPKAKKLVERAKKIEVKAKQAVQVKDYTEHNKRIATMNAQIDKLSTAVTLHIQAAKRDEDEAIKALLEII